jgi:hypothetical protein
MSTQLEFTLKSGAVVVADVESFTYSRTGFNRAIEWKDAPRAKKRLITVDMDSVAAIVEVTR